MKKLIIFTLLISSILFGQTQDELDLCMAIQTSNFTSNTDAENALDKILNTIGASKNFVLTPCEKINNAIATAYKGTRYILYDKEFMDLISENTNDWSNLFILAHEVGHHINGHLLDILLYMEDDIGSPTLEKKRQQELEADEFAAFVLAKLGANLSDLKSVIKIISVDKNDINSTHPNTEKRIASIEKGFKKGFVNEKTTKSNYVDFENDESFLKFGNWFREQNRSYQGDITWKSFSEGKNIKTEKSDLLGQNLILEANKKTNKKIHTGYPDVSLSTSEIIFSIDEKQFKSIILNRFRKFINENKEKKYFVGKHNTNQNLFEDIFSKERKIKFSVSIEMSAKNSDGKRIDEKGFEEFFDTYYGPPHDFYSDENIFNVYYDLRDETIDISANYNTFYFKYFPLIESPEVKVDKIILSVKFYEIERINEYSIRTQFSSPTTTYYIEYDMRGAEKSFSNDYVDHTLIDLIKNKYYKYFE